MKRKPHPLNAPGDYYVVDGDCMACCAPEAEAPELMSHAETPHYHCYFKKQPTSPTQLDQAIRACQVSCVAAVRYGGKNPRVIERLHDIETEASCDEPPQKR